MVGGSGDLVVRYGTSMVGRVMDIAAVMTSVAYKKVLSVNQDWSGMNPFPHHHTGGNLNKFCDCDLTCDGTSFLCYTLSRSANQVSSLVTCCRLILIVTTRRIQQCYEVFRLRFFHVCMVRRLQSNTTRFKHSEPPLHGNNYYKTTTLNKQHRNRFASTPPPALKNSNDRAREKILSSADIASLF